MKDKFGREIDYMRISVTEQCNYRCFYCMPQEENIKPAKENPITKNEILDIVKVGVKLGIKKIRITGGEPLIRKDIDKILYEISKIKEIKELCLTTNGSILNEKIEFLKICGVTRINVSLDSLKEKKFKEITKTGDFNKVWKGIKRAIENGIEVRINSVIIDGVNEDEIINLASLTETYPIDVRFIELMPIGEGKRYKGFTGNDIRMIICKSKKLKNLKRKEGASEYYRLEGGKGQIGFINPISNCFCQECNRIRVTSKGIMKQCLNKKSTFKLSNIMKNSINEKEKIEIIAKEIYNKPEKHLFNNINKFEDEYNMNQIGG